jgi:putative DNA primase/helicase
MNAPTSSFPSDSAVDAFDEDRFAAIDGIEEKPNIRVVPGELGRIVDEAELALIRANRGLYQRDGKIVFISYTPAKTSRGEATTTIQILERQEHALIVDMAQAATFERFDKRSKKWVTADPPILAVKALREHGLGKFRFPTLHGVITAPTLRADGTVLSSQGYDAATGLFFDQRGVVFRSIPERPTRAEAEGALARITKLIENFPFVTSYDRSVALSAILTACVRRSLPTAPLHAFTAPTAGTGKSKLVDIASVIATGFKAAPLSHGGNEEETEKRLASKLMAGEPFIAIDNCTQPLCGDLICSLLTQERVSPRILGVSKTPSISTGAFLAANGNNLAIKGDLVRRTMLCRIDAKVEQPETRVFAGGDPVESAMAKRAELVVALTILRAYEVAGRPKQSGHASPLGSFECWSDLVRDALIWLGEADPVESMNQLRKRDPILEAVRAVMGQWREAFGNQSVTAVEVIRTATKMRQNIYEGLELEHPDFRDALMAVAGRGNALSGIALGKWLGVHRDKIVDDHQFVEMGTRSGAVVWALQ